MSLDPNTNLIFGNPRYFWLIGSNIVIVTCAMFVGSNTKRRGLGLDVNKAGGAKQQQHKNKATICSKREGEKRRQIRYHGALHSGI